MNFKFFRLLWIIVTLTGLNNSIAQPGISKIAFGSCANQDKPLPILDLIVKHKPDLFIFLGDNIYGDTEIMDTLRHRYQRLGNKPSYQNLQRSIPIIATWDDHDYGLNDTGKHYPYKNESKELFLDFFKEPINSNRRTHPGIYTSYVFKEGSKKLQVILLDNRTFRDDLRKYDTAFSAKKYFYTPDYLPYENGDSTFLGEEQWNWLEKELLIPADIRIIGSGTQFGIEFNGYEAWANFPHEQKRFLELIIKTKANGVLFITGDSHYAEISRLDYEGLYPVYDITSSGLSSLWDFATPNKNRIEGPVMTNNFGMLSINWKLKDPVIKMEIWDVRDNQRIEYSIKLSELHLK